MEIVPAAPIFLLWFGLAIWSKVALGVTVVFFVVFFNTYRMETSPRGFSAVVTSRRVGAATGYRVVRPRVVGGPRPHWKKILRYPPAMRADTSASTRGSRRPPGYARYRGDHTGSNLSLKARNPWKL